MLALELKLGVGELGVQVLQRLRHVAVQGDVSIVNQVVDKEEHIDEGDAVIVHAAHHPSVALLVHGVGGVQQSGHLNVQVCQLRELPGRQAVGEDIAVHGLNVGKAQGGLHFRHGLQVPQQAALLLIVPGGHQDGDGVHGAKGVVHLLLGDLRFILGEGGKGAHAEHIGASVGKEEARHQQHRENGRHDEPRLHR